MATKQKVFVIVAWIVGAAAALAHVLLGIPWTTQSLVALVPVLILVVNHTLDFFSSPLPTDPQVALTQGEGVATADKKSARGFVRIELLLVGLLAVVPLAFLATDCSQEQAQSAENFVVDLADASCIELVDDGVSPWVDFVCTIVESVPTPLPATTSSAPVATATTIKKFTVHVKRAQAASFAATYAAH